jgi:hypothetical protein
LIIHVAEVVLVLKAHKVLKAPKVLKAHKVLLVVQDLQGLLALKVPLVLRELRVHRV